MTAGGRTAGDGGGKGGRRRLQHRRNQRAGRFRRWLLRPLVWLLVALAVLVAGLVLYGNSDAAHERVRRLLAAQLGDYLGRRVEIAAVDVHLVSSSLTVTDLVVASPDGFDRPFARVPRATIEFGLRGGPRRITLTVRRVEAFAPEVNVLLAADGATNLPDLRPSEGEVGGRLEVRFGALVVERGLLRVVDREIPLDLRAEGVWGRLTGPPGALNGPGRAPVFTVQAAAAELTTTLPDAAPYTGGFTFKGTVGAGRVEIATARLAGPDLIARAHGHVAWDGEGTEVRVEIDADGALALANRLGYLGEPIGGRFGFVGEVDARGGAWSYRGNVRSPVVAFAGRRFTEVVADLAGRFGAGAGDASDSGGALTVELHRAGYAGGTLAGTLVAATGAAPVPMQLVARLEDAALAPVLADLDLDLAGLTGRVDGELTYDFTSADPGAGRGWGTIELAGVERRPGALPVAGQASFVVDRGILTSDTVALEAREQRAVGSASLDFATGRGRLAFTLTSGDLGGLTPILPLADDPDFAPWLPTAGAGTVAGDLEISAAGTTGTLSVDLRQPVTPSLAVDTLAGSLRLAPAAIEDLRMEATRDGGALIATGRVPLAVDGQPAEDSGLEVAFDAVDWPAASLAFLLPQPPAVEVGGKVSGRVTLAGGFAALSGTAEVSAEPLVLSGFAIDRAEATITFSPARVAVERFTAALPAGEATINGTWELATDALDFAVTAPAVDLGAPPLTDLLPSNLGGRLAVQGVIVGTAAAPAATLNLTGEALTLGGRPLGEAGGAYLDATWLDGEATAQGSLLGLLDFSGGGRLESGTAELSFAVTSEHLAELIELGISQPLAEVAGGFAGTLTVRGDPSTPAELTARLELDRLAATFQGRRIENLEPVVARLAGGRLSLDSLFLGEQADGAEASELFVAGSIDLRGDEAVLALNVQSSLAATWAELFFPQIDADGAFELLATVRGTLSEPQVSGQGEVRDGRLILSGFPHALDHLQATVLFYPKLTVIDSLEAAFAGGRVRAAGRVDLGRLDEGKVEYRLQATGTGMSIRYPAGFLLRGDANLSLVSTADGRQLVGTIDLTRAFYLEDVPVKVTQLLQRFLQRQRVEAGETDEDLASTQLNLSIRGPDALRVHNNLADLKGDVALTVRGTLANPAVFGSIEAAPGGTIVYADNDYKVERALLTFSNPNQIDPVIDLVATTEVRDYDVTLQLAGTLERLDASFTSNPPLADLDVLALLTTGQTVGSGSLGGSAVDGEAQGTGGAQTFLYGQAASVITDRVNQLFGFDRFRVNPITGSGGGGTSVAFTVGKQISRDLYVTYSRDPTSNLDYVLQAEWAVTPGVTLVLTQNGTRSYAIDVRWEHRF